MKPGTKIAIVFLTLSLASCKSSVQENETRKPTPEFNFSKVKKSTFPKPIGILNDYGHIFTESQRTELSEILYNYAVKTTRQITVVTIDSIKPYQNIQSFAAGLGNYWGVGTAEKNNGLVIVVSRPLKQIGIATGTELVLTDEICKEIIHKIIIPEFKNGDIYSGIKKGVTALIEKWN